MSRTAKDDKKRGPLAYGKGHKQRAYGYEFWTPRPGSRNPGKKNKIRTHRLERRAAKKEETPE